MLELFENGRYSYKSDIYSFGVLLWEIATRSSNPWENVSRDVIQLRVKMGHRPQIPNDCPKDFSDIICKCWEQKPEDRPTTFEILENLQEFLVKPNINNNNNNDTRCHPRSCPNNFCIF